jgi:membrane protease YdiL (CAAX protease family)
MEGGARQWPLGYVPVGVAAIYALRLLLDALPGLSPAAAQVVFDVLVIAVPVGLAAAAHAARPRMFGARRMRITPGRAALWIFLGSVLTTIASAIYIVAFDVNGHLWITDQSPSGTQAVVLGVTAVTLVPVAEEVFWRGFVHRALRTHLPLWPAVALSASLFGLAHWVAGDDFSTVAPRVFYGVLLALLLERTGSLYPGIVAHAYVNVPLFAFFVPSVAWLPPLILLVALIVAVAVSVDDERRKHPRTGPQVRLGERAMGAHAHARGRLGPI